MLEKSPPAPAEPGHTLNGNVIEALDCDRCGDPLSERYFYPKGRVELYCAACENTRLWRLGRSVGK